MIPAALYIFVETVLLFLIKLLDFSKPYSLVGKLEYAAIVLDFLVVLIIFAKKHRNSGKPWFYRHGIVLAMALTLLADTFLVLLESFSVPWVNLPGVLSFCTVQTVYAFYLKPSGKEIGIRLAAFGVLAAGLLMLHMADPLNVCAAWSIVWLTGNMIKAWRVYGKCDAPDRKAAAAKHSAFLLALGLTLFFLCDVSVGIYNLTFGVEGLETLCGVFYFLIWIFYLPSQVLIPLSYLFN